MLRFAVAATLSLLGLIASPCQAEFSLAGWRLQTDAGFLRGDDISHFLPTLPFSFAHGIRAAGGEAFTSYEFPEPADTTPTTFTFGFDHVAWPTVNSQPYTRSFSTSGMRFNNDQPLQYAILGSYTGNYNPQSQGVVNGLRFFAALETSNGSAQVFSAAAETNEPGTQTLSLSDVTPHPVYASSGYQYGILPAGSWRLVYEAALARTGSASGSLDFRFAADALVGDFNLDGVRDGADVDLLFRHRGTDNPLFDLNADELVNDADVQHLITQVLGVRFGDADLNGQVTIGDLTIVAEHIGRPGGWASGDFNGDGVVAIGDLTIMAENFNLPALPAPIVSTVPSPASFLSALAGVALLAARRRRP